MSKYYFSFRTVTQAQHARVLLRRYGIIGELVQAPVEVSDAGCAHALRVQSTDRYRAAKILKQEGILYIELSQMSDRGSEVGSPWSI